LFSLHQNGLSNEQSFDKKTQYFCLSSYFPYIKIINKTIWFRLDYHRTLRLFFNIFLMEIRATKCFIWVHLIDILDHEYNLAAETMHIKKVIVFFALFIQFLLSYHFFNLSNLFLKSFLFIMFRETISTFESCLVFTNNLYGYWLRLCVSRTDKNIEEEI
jgi:hypothetical protein